VNNELRKYYRRTYISPQGPKHDLYLKWRDEWARENGLTVLQRMYLM